MVIGAAGELPKPPEKPIVFLEGECRCARTICMGCDNRFCADMDESEIAEAVCLFYLPSCGLFTVLLL